MSSTNASDLAIIDELSSELAKMRGANIHGAAPVLDFEGGAAEPTTFMTAAAEEDAVAEEALARMQEQMTQAAALSHQGARAALQAQLDQNDEEGEAQRRALNGYLEELKGREDEAGDRIRAAEFTQEVDALVEEQRRAAADAAGPHVHDIIQHVHDPATFEALLEVQRLDEALESVPTTARQQQQQQPVSYYTSDAADDRIRV